MALFALGSLLLPLAGCWNQHELNKTFIVTGIALDQAEESGLLEVSLQIEKSEPESASSGSEGGQEKSSPTLVLKSVKSTMAQGIADINLRTSREVFIPHNQIMLFGTALAEEGMEQYMDMLLRDPESRMDVQMAIVDGKASDVLAADTGQELVSGTHLSNIINQQSQISTQYSTRITDFVRKLLSGSSSPVVPIVKLTKENEKESVSIEGMAVFVKDKLVGRLSNDEAQSYVWAMGDVKGGSFTAGSGDNLAVFLVDSLDCKRKVKKNGQSVRVEFEVDTVLRVSQIIGFTEVKFPDLIQKLTQTAQEEIKKKVEQTYESARGMGADIYDLGLSVYRKDPGEWESMKDQWGELFSKSELEVSVRAQIVDLGKSLLTIGMESASREGR